MDPRRIPDLAPAPTAIFARLPEWRQRPRYHVQDGSGRWRAVSWGGHGERIRQLALFLAAGPLAPGERAAVFAPNRVAWMEAALAIQAAGGVLVPVYPLSTPEQAARVVAHSDARVVFVDCAACVQAMLAAWEGWAGVRCIVTLDDALDLPALLAAQPPGRELPQVAELAVRCVRWSEALARGRAVQAAEPARFDALLGAVALDQPGLMLYTSGTTGDSRGVVLTHRNVGVNGRDWQVVNAPLLGNEDDSDLLWLPMSHIFGYGEACQGNALGFTTWLADPARVLGLLPRLRPTVFMSVPAYWEKLAQAALAAPDLPRQRARLLKATGGRLRFCLSGGAGLKREVKELFHACGLLIIEGYGLTECSPTLTLNRADAFRFDSVGLPLPSVELKLAADGEILTRGPHVFAGYHKDAAATRAAFTADGWFMTGDVGRFTEDGFLQIVDRKKEILVLATGKNVPPQAIELRFRGDPYIAHLVVYGEGRHYLVAGVWLNDDAVQGWLAQRGVAQGGRAAALRELLEGRIAAVNAGLARHETIKRFAVMEPALTPGGGFLTPTLKLRRRQVYEAFRERFEALYADPPAARA